MKMTRMMAAAGVAALLGTMALVPAAVGQGSGANDHGAGHGAGHGGSMGQMMEGMDHGQMMEGMDQGTMMEGMDHGQSAGGDAAGAGHGAHAGHGDQAGASDSPSTAAYLAANDAMHAAMNIPFTGDADIDFARGMIGHHEGAIAMARIVLEHGEDPDLRHLAEEIIAAQEAEIAFLRDWIATHAE